jgi:hypothetical protein
VAIHRPVETKYAEVLTVAVALLVLWLSPCVYLIPSRFIEYPSSVFPPNSLAVFLWVHFMCATCPTHANFISALTGTEYVELYQLFFASSFADPQTFLGICCGAPSISNFCSAVRERWIK